MSAGLVLLVRTVLAALFIVAVAGKLAGHGRWLAFRSSLAALVPGRGRPAAVGVVAVAVVTAEAATAAGLVLPVGWPLGLAAAALLLVAFAAGIGYALRRGLRVRCRCFGASGGELGAAELVRNVVLAVAAAAALAVDAGPPTAATVALVLPLGLAAGYALSRWEDLLFAVAPAT